MIVAGTTIHIDAGITLDLNKVIAATQVDRLDIRYRQRIPGIPEGQGVDAGAEIDIEAELAISQENVFIGSCAGQFLSCELPLSSRQITTNVPLPRSAIAGSYCEPLSASALIRKSSPTF